MGVYLKIKNKRLDFKRLFSNRSFDFHTNIVLFKMVFTQKFNISNAWKYFGVLDVFICFFVDINIDINIHFPFEWFYIVTSCFVVNILFEYMRPDNDRKRNSLERCATSTLRPLLIDEKKLPLKLAFNKKKSHFSSYFQRWKI